jgi:hypothetical protein
MADKVLPPNTLSAALQTTGTLRMQQVARRDSKRILDQITQTQTRTIASTGAASSIDVGDVMTYQMTKRDVHRLELLVANYTNETPYAVEARKRLLVELENIRSVREEGVCERDAVENAVRRAFTHCVFSPGTIWDQNTELYPWLFQYLTLDPGETVPKAYKIVQN